MLTTHFTRLLVGKSYAQRSRLSSRSCKRKSVGRGRFKDESGARVTKGSLPIQEQIRAYLRELDEVAR